MALRTLALTAVLAAVSLGVHAQTNPEDHAAHHPEGASAPAAQAPAPAPAPAAAASATPAGTPGAMMSPALMQQHMKAMQAMHEKMAKARTPKEREALMAEHMKLMQDGMAMMNGMGGMSAMGPASGAAAAPNTPAARMQRLEQRMDMMQSMMDRLPPPPAKP